MADLLHVITGLDRGGAELQLLRTVRSLRRDGRQLVVSLRPAGAVASELEDLGCRVVCADIGSGPLAAFTGTAAALRAVSQQRYDIVLGWLYHGMTAAYVLRRLSFRTKPLIWMVRSSLAALDGMSSLSRANVKLARALSDNPEAIVYNSARAAAEHEAFGFASARAEVIHNGIDAERFSFTEEARRRARQALGINPEDVLVGFVARYHPVKDHRTFFDAAKIIGERHAQVRFALFGKGISRENTELVNLVTGANLADRCILAGERADVPDLLPGFDVAVNSSLSEGFSNTVAEAMMSQVPCVATDVGDSAVIVGEFGRVVSPSAPFELAANLGDLISLPAEARRLLGENARRHAEAHFSTATADTKLRNLLERVAAPSRS